MKMKKILLIVESPSKKDEFINVLPPLGVLSIASYLESKGLKVDVIDYNVEANKKIVNFSDYLLIGFSVNCSNKIRSLELAKRIKTKHPATEIVFGGPDIIGAPLEYIKKEFIDAVIFGEGEEALYEYIKKSNKKKIHGLYYKDKNGKVIFTGKQIAKPDLEKLPFPALDKIPLDQYYSPIKKKKKFSSIITSRGCPYQCIFCFNHLGKKWRAQSPERVVSEMEWQKQKFGVQEFIVYDDNFALDIKRALKICDLIIEKKLNIKFQFQNGLRCDNLTKDLLIKMKKAGCWLIAIAPETGNQETLEKIKKNAKLEKFQEVVQWCKEVGISTYSFFMLGFPWESKKELLDTIRFAIKLDTDLVQFSRVIPFKNTKLFDYVDKKDPSFEEYNLFLGSNRFQLKDVSENEFNEIIKLGYQKCYLKPRKMFKLLKILRFKDILKLALFARKSKSI